MVCIYCSGELAVSNSRPQLSRNQTWRRRLCKACGAVFTSIEAIDLSQALVVQQSGHNSRKHNETTNTKVAKSAKPQPFDRDRLFISIYESLRHRPTAAHDAHGLTDTVSAYIIKNAQTQNIPNSHSNHSYTDSRTIAETVLSTLKRFDQAAATHYAAFHQLKD